MRLAELQAAGRHPQLPLRVTLADGAGAAELRLDSLLRVLPGQRYVGAGEWRGRKVLAKLLVGGKAARHFQRELEGARLLAAQGLTTPALLADGLQEGEGGWLLFDYLDAAQSLGDAWRAVEAQAPLGDAQQAVLGEALAAIGELHAKGLWQDDLHLDNLLRHAGHLYLIDGGGVRAKLPASRCRDRKCWKTSGCSSPSCRRSSILSWRSCWCITCWPTASMRCRSKPCRRKSPRFAAGGCATC